MTGKKCEPGCTCNRHNPHPLKGKKKSDEFKKKVSEARQGQPGSPCHTGCTCKRHSVETRERLSESHQRKHREDPEFREKFLGRMSSLEYRRNLSQSQSPSGSYLYEGYRMLLRKYDHPLSYPNGNLPEHREVLYEKIGPGTHRCHWCNKELEWGGRFGIHVDHLDWDRLNNTDENLVPSCLRCNWHRKREQLTEENTK